MKNELSPLECLRIVKEFALEFIENNLDKRLIIGGCDIIETELKDYEKQKQLVQTLQDKIYVKEMKYAKQEKALEIIKEKKVDIAILIESESLYDYNDYMNNSDIYNEYGNSRQLTKEEFDLLKEVLL